MWFMEPFSLSSSVLLSLVLNKKTGYFF